MVHLERFLKTCIGMRKSWKSEDESRPYRLQLCGNQTEYRDKSWRQEGACCNSGSNERLLVYNGKKIARNNNINNINNNNKNNKADLQINKKKIALSAGVVEYTGYTSTVR